MVIAIKLNQASEDVLADLATALEKTPADVLKEIVQKVLKETDLINEIIG